MVTNTIEVLRDLGKVVERLKENPPSNYYWREADKFLIKRLEGMDNFNKSLEISEEKLYKKFDL
jgi:hypothetical protein